jgi:8-oxo-dGTP pyrophosphatase MutT (NUDIX family)
MRDEPDLAAAVVRPTARVLVVSPAQRVLLFTTTWPDRESGRRFWFTPGGGLEADESHDEAARRELREEIGVELAVGPCLWSREHTWWTERHQRWIRSVERYYLAHAPSEELGPIDWGDAELQEIAEMRWWSVADIAASGDLFVPRALAALLPDVLAGRLPAEPFDVS